MGLLLSNTNGSVSVYYTPTQVGTYALQMNYTGESFADGTIVYESATSTITTLNVTTEPQPTPTPTPEPTPAPTSTPEPTPTPEISEFPSWIILPTLITTLVAGFIHRRKRKR